MPSNCRDGAPWHEHNSSSLLISIPSENSMCIVHDLKIFSQECLSHIHSPIWLLAVDNTPCIERMTLQAIRVVFHTVDHGICSCEHTQGDTTCYTCHTGSPGPSPSPLTSMPHTGTPCMQDLGLSAHHPTRAERR